MRIPGQPFPQFKVKACVGLDKNGITEVSNDTYPGKWVVYFFYPKDFSFVCPMELVEFAKKNREFTDRGAVLVAGSTDNEYSHQAWRKVHPDLKELPYPMIAAQKLAFDLGIVHDDAHACVRATFLVDPHNVIQWACANPLPVGRSVAEVLRVLDAIQADVLGVCNWTPGDPPLKG